MIRTVMTLRMGSNDLQDTTFLINDTQVGYLSQSTRRNQVFSSHRYIQLIAGFRADHTQPDAQERQRESLRLWQRCSRDVQQRGLSVLSQAAGHYNLFPEWLIGLDNKYLHAWLTGDFTVCLMRDGELFQVDPVADQYSKMPDRWLGSLHQSTVELMEGDYFLFLPPTFFDVVSAAETQNILNGMQQLSVKINELVDLGRIRGYELDSSWIALQVQKIEFDTAQGPSLKDKIAGFTGMFKKPDPAEAARIRAESSSLRQKSPVRGEASSSYGERPYVSGDNSVTRSDDYQPTEAELAAAAARASMRYGKNSYENSIPVQLESADDMHAQHNSHRRSVTAEARNRADQNIKLFSIWQGWRREQKWLAVLLAISVLILVAWGISTALNKGEGAESTTTTTTAAAAATPTPIPPTETTTAAPAEIKLKVAARSLNFREAPGTDAGLITTLNEGTVVIKVEDAEEGWVKVRLEDGREAYAFGEYLQVVQEDSETSQE